MARKDLHDSIQRLTSLSLSCKPNPDITLDLFATYRRKCSAVIESAISLDIAIPFEEKLLSLTSTYKAWYEDLRPNPIWVTDCMQLDTSLSTQNPLATGPVQQNLLGDQNQGLNFHHGAPIKFTKFNVQMSSACLQSQNPCDAVLELGTFSLNAFLT